MKFIIPILLLLSPVTFASDYNAVTHQLTADESSYYAGPRRPADDPTPFNEPDPRDYGNQRNPYPNPDDSPDYQRDDRDNDDDARYSVQSYDEQPWQNDPRFKGIICQNALLALHSGRWH